MEAAGGRGAPGGGWGGGPLPAAPAHPRPVPRKDWRRWWGYASPLLNRLTSPQLPHSQIPHRPTGPALHSPPNF